MDKESIIRDLKEIKKSIFESAQDTLWMSNSGDTAIERIDTMLVCLGCDRDEVETETQWFMTAEDTGPLSSEVGMKGKNE